VALSYTSSGEGANPRRSNLLYVVLQLKYGAGLERSRTLMNDSISSAKWRTLYRIGAIAILIAVIFFRRYYGAELSAFNGFGIYGMPEIEPVSALEWFGVLQEYPYVGLSWLGIRDLVNYVLVSLFFLALYVALRKNSPSLMMIAISAGLLGVGVYLVSNQAFALYGLSHKFAAATSETQRQVYLAAGESLLAIHNPAGLPNLGAGIFISLFFVFTAGLLFSVVMLRSEIFSKTTAIMGILTNSLGLLLFPLLILAPEFHWISPTASAPFRMIWYVMSAIQLLKLSKEI